MTNARKRAYTNRMNKLAVSRNAGVCDATRSRPRSGRPWGLIAVLLAALATAASAADAVDLLPHEAVYAMTLGDRQRPGDVVSAGGQMVYRFAETCEGWTVENRTLLALGYEDGRIVRTRWSFTSFETADGETYRFSSRYDQNGRTLEKLRGTVGRQSVSEAAGAVFAEPDDTLVRLPRGTLFPTDHVRAMIEAAEAGELTVGRVVFDGASLDNPYFVNSVITPVSAAERERLAETAGLPPRATWRIRMAFFPYHTDTELPDFEIEALYRADGVADEIVQHFDEFSLRVRLTSLEKLPPPDC